jgi:hypothetical protein
LNVSHEQSQSPDKTNSHVLNRLSEQIMKTAKIIFATVAIVLLSQRSQTYGAVFSSGSTGADGPLNVTNDIVLPLPPNGIFNFTTINVPFGAALRFQRNELNTPVYLLASSNVTINGTIEVSGSVGLTSVGGEGGPGGFDGGNPSSGQSPPGDGYGPGGGVAGSDSPSDPARARSGTYATTTLYSSSNRYGNVFLLPLVGGSGGGGKIGGGGGGGGGALLIASSTQIDLPSISSSRILANGGQGYNGGSVYNWGSGGAIRLVAPKVMGSGTIQVNAGGIGGDGRTRIDTQDRSQMNLNLGGTARVSNNMTVFSSPSSRLDIVEVAGRTIPSGTNGTIRIQLPLNSPTNQTVKLTATDFVGPVSLEVVITPDNGSALRFPASFDMGGSNQVTLSVNVIVPPDVPCRVNAWTR